MTQQLLDTEDEIIRDGVVTELDISHLEIEDDRWDEDDIVHELDISHLVIEDDTPVDNLQSEKQQRLLVEPLYSSKAIPAPFLAAANVGLFYKLKGDPVVPDVMLSLGVQCAADFSQKQNRAYFVWEFGKVPDICIEIVSNRKGNELDSKKDDYAQIGVPYYAVFDPLQQLQRENELNNQMLKVWILNAGDYVETAAPYWLRKVGLGLIVWEGVFEGQESSWLRWCNQEGQVIPTGAERADRLADRLRAAGINPDEV